MKNLFMLLFLFFSVLFGFFEKDENPIDVGEVETMADFSNKNQFIEFNENLYKVDFEKKNIKPPTT